MDKVIYTWKEFEKDTLALAYLCEGGEYEAIFGVPRGGCCLAVRMSSLLRLPLVARPDTGVLVVDEVIDSGATRNGLRIYNFACLHKKCNAQYIAHTMTYSLHNVGPEWIVYPWEG